MARKRRKNAQLTKKEKERVKNPKLPPARPPARNIKKQTVSEKAKGKAQARSVSVSSASSHSSSLSSSSSSSSSSNITFYFKKEYMPKDLREALRVNNDIPFLLKL